VETLELLEEQLMNYRGTLLVVSHDREFLDNVVTSSYVLAGDGEVRVCAGGYAEAARLLKRLGEKGGRDSPAKVDAKDASPGDSRARKLSYNEKRELDALPAQMEALEREIADIEAALADPTLFSADNARAMALTARLPHARDELDAIETRWLELSERA
jgi:ATP-binding cassette subfamily F protein uup